MLDIVLLLESSGSQRDLYISDILFFNVRRIISAVYLNIAESYYLEADQLFIAFGNFDFDKLSVFCFISFIYNKIIIDVFGITIYLIELYGKVTFYIQYKRKIAGIGVFFPSSELKTVVICLEVSCLILRQYMAFVLRIIHERRGKVFTLGHQLCVRQKIGILFLVKDNILQFNFFHICYLPHFSCGEQLEFYVCHVNSRKAFPKLS